MKYLSSPAMLLWELAGRPVPKKPTKKTTEPCYICAETISEGVEKKKAFGGNFTDFDSAKSPQSDCVCVPCLWSMSGKPPDTLRMWSVLFREDGKTSYTHEKAPITHPGLAFMNKSDMREAINMLLNPPDCAWFLALSDSGKIHTTPFAEMNHGLAWTIRLERENISLNSTVFPDIFRTAGRLYMLGFSKAEILSGDCAVGKIAKQAENLPLIRELFWKLRIYTHSPILKLATFLLKKDYIHEYIETEPDRGRVDRSCSEPGHVDHAVSIDTEHTPAGLVGKGQNCTGNSRSIVGKPAAHGVEDGRKASDTGTEGRFKQLSFGFESDFRI